MSLDIAGPPLFVFIPFIAFSIVFLFILLIKLCMVIGHGGDWRTFGRLNRFGHLRTRPVSTSSGVSVDLVQHQHPVQRTHHRQPSLHPQPNTGASNRPPSPPSYYAGMASPVMFYPMYVPPFPTAVNLESYRDPRHFQGLAGIQAPPPYPPPPSYSQIANIPELPHVSNPRLGTSGGSTAKSMDDFPPVDD